jgi:hypothetical protein
MTNISNWAIVLLTLVLATTAAIDLYLYWNISYSKFSINDVPCPYNFSSNDTMNYTTNFTISIGNYGEMPMLLSFDFTGDNVNITKEEFEGKNYSKYQSFALHPVKNGGEKINIYLNLSIIYENRNTANFTINLWSNFAVFGHSLFEQHVGDLPVFCNYTKNDTNMFVLNKILSGKMEDNHGDANQRVRNEIKNIIALITLVITVGLIICILRWKELKLGITKDQIAITIIALIGILIMIIFGPTAFIIALIGIPTTTIFGPTAFIIALIGILIIFLKYFGKI